MFLDEHVAAAEALLAQLRARGWKLATAESCTGGLIAGLLTEIGGSSDVVERGFVTYSNEAKVEMLGVDAAIIARHGAVSEPTARAMAEGACRRAPVDIAVAVTGVAGPTGGSEAKPVGLVHIAIAVEGRETTHRKCLFGSIGRRAVRVATVATALDMLAEAAAQTPS